MQLQPKHSYKVIGFSSRLSPVYRQKFLSLGIMPGSLLFIVRIAPLGDPIQIETRRMRLIVRRKDLALLNLDRLHQ